MNDEHKNLMRVKEVAKLLGISKELVYKIAATGELTSVRVTARAIRFEPKEVEKFVAQRREPRLFSVKRKPA